MTFTPLFSIFVLLASGYLAKRIKLIPQTQLIIFIDFVLNFAMPALIFDKVYHVVLDAKILGVTACGLLSQFGAAIVAFYIGKALRFSKATIASMTLLAMFGNTLFVGLPVVSGMLGEEMQNQVILYDQIATCVPVALLAPLILSYAAPANISLVKNVIKIMKFPPFIALILGLAAKPFALPEFIFAPMELFASSVVPVALFAVGLGLGFGGVRSAYKSTAIVIALRMFFAPALFAALAFIFNLSVDSTYMVGVIESAMPPMVLASAMILKAGLDSNLAISSVALGVCATFVNIPLIFWLFM